MDVLKAPSFYAHVLHGFFILFAFVFVLQNFNSIKNLDIFKKLIIILFFALLFGVHSLSHLGLEAFYHFNPFQ
jgi:hypothetical protein